LGSIYGFSSIEGTTQCAEALIAKKAGGVLCAVASLEGERGGRGLKVTWEGGKEQEMRLVR